MKEIKLCKNCEHLKSAKTGYISYRYWCGLTGNGYDNKALGIRPWIEKPHPKCPLSEGKAKMKTRENELHEPKIIKVEEKVGDCGSSVEFLGQCTVCGFTYSRNPDWINYCPKCGARLKEIEE